jgi:nitric oxide reductase NorD protein
VIELADVEATLALFAEGIAGRYFHIVPSGEFAGRRAHLDAATAGLTRDTLYLPERIDAPDAAVYRVLALQQLGQREFGTYRFDFEEALRRTPEIAADGGFERARAALPGVRASDFERFCHCFAEPALANRLLHLCERVRIDALLVHHYPGAGRHMRRYYAHLIERDPPPLVTSIATALQVLDCLAVGLDSRVAGALDVTGVVESCARIIERIRTDPADVYQSAAACTALVALLTPLFQTRDPALMLPLDEELNGPASWMQRETRLQDWRDELAGLDQHLAGLELLDGDDPMAGDAEGLTDGELRPEDSHIAGIRKTREALARRIDMERSAIQDAFGREHPNARSFHYDEWDYLAHRYLHRHCRLFEERLLPDPEQDLAPLVELMRRHRPRVQKQLELIRPLGYQRVFRVSDGDELDFNAAIQAMQDRRAGRAPDDRVYSRRERVHRDVCAVFLVDLSASTDDPVDKSPPVYPPEDDDSYPNLRDPFGAADRVVEPEPAPRRIIDVQREAMLIMSAGLESLGDRYGIYGFSGYGHDCVELFVAKEPDERFGGATLAAIAGMKPKRSTRMGPAIRHGVRKLVDSGSALKVLIVLSDGFPQDSDYGPERGNHEYGVQDTARALQEAHDKGVETFCVTVDRSGHDYLRRMCPDARYLVIEEIEDLPDALTKVYRTLTV